MMTGVKAYCVDAARLPSPRRRDLRRGEEWTALQTVKNGLLRLLIRGSLAIADRLPEKVLLHVCVGAAWLAHLLSRSACVEALALAQSLNHTDPRRFVLVSFLTAGRNLARTLMLRRPNFRVRSRVIVDDGDVRALQLLQQGRTGIVFSSLHFGPFEWTAALIAELGLRPVVVARSSYDPGLNAIVDFHRATRGVEVIHRTGDKPLVSIVRALREGRPVGLMLDLARSVRTSNVNLHGRSLSLAEGPFRLASRLGCPLLLGLLIPTTTGHAADFQLRLFHAPTSGNEDALRTYLATTIADVIARHGEHWLVWGQRFSRHEGREAVG